MEGLSIERNECTLRKFNCQLVAVGIDLRSSENNIYNIYLCIYYIFKCILSKMYLIYI